MNEALAGQVRRIAYRKTKDVPYLYEDAAQEGMIAAWQELEKTGREDFAVRSARLRIAKVLGGKPLTGEPRHAGRRDAHDDAIGLVRTNDKGEEWFLKEPADARALALYEQAEARADLEDVVADALAELAPEDRVAVSLVFWQGMTWRDAAKRMGRPEGTLTRRWAQTIRPALADALAEVAAC